jgi:spore germination protein GerM
MKKLIILLIIVAAVGYFYFKRGNNEENVQPKDKISTVGEVEPKDVESGSESGSEKSTTVAEPAQPAAVQEGQTTSAPEIALADGAAPIHYFKKDNLEECSLETATVERKLDSKYKYAPVAALVELTKSLPKDSVEAGFVSALLPGTRFMNLRIDRDGKATADFNNKLNEELGECRKEQRRSQIINTLKQFPEIKEIVITVDKILWQ